MGDIRKAFGVGLVPPTDASRFFAQKKWLLPSFNWDDVYGAEHAAGVAVAGMSQRDVLQLFADELQRTIDAGGDLRGFKKRMEAALIKAGLWGSVEVTNPQTGEKRITKFDQRRLELIFNTNVRAAQAAGQYERALGAKGAFPYMVYLSQADERVRPLHQAWHGTVLPVDHPFWHTHLPPNGWNCRCRFMSVDEREIKVLAARGVPIKREPPPGWKNTVEHVRKGTGEIVRGPVGIDPGFAHNPALSRLRGVLPDFVNAFLRTPLPDALPATAPSLPALPAATEVGAALLVPQDANAANIAQAFVEALPGAGANRVVTDPTGYAWGLSADLLTKASAQSIAQVGQYARLIAATFAEPTEVWESVLQAKSLRTSIGLYSVDGQAVAIAVRWGKGQWQAAVHEGAGVPSEWRQGTRVYVKP